LIQIGRIPYTEETLYIWNDVISNSSESPWCQGNSASFSGGE